MVKKIAQQGRSPFSAQSVLPLREHCQRARTPLGGVNISLMDLNLVQI